MRAGSMAPGSQPFSNEEMRRTCDVLDVLTTFKRRTKQTPPTATLIRRKLDNLSIPALDTLSILVDHTISEKHRRLSPRQVCGMVQAVRCFPDETAAEVAHVHACNEVVSAAAVNAASFEAGHVLRIGLHHLEAARKRGIPLCPIATDLHACSMAACLESKKKALEMIGVGDALVQDDGSFASTRGLLTGAAFCLAVMHKFNPGDICCGVCYEIVSGDDLSICHRCGDHLSCKGCLGHTEHVRECRRVRSKVRDMAHLLTPHLRESVRRVAVVQLNSFGLMAPMKITSIASPLVPSTLLESLSRRSTLVTHGEVALYWRLLISFLAHKDGDAQEAIEYERVYNLQAATYVHAEQPNVQTSKATKLLPSERRRLQKEREATERRTKEEERAAAESAAMAEANAVLERQSARPDVTSAVLTSVLAKRESAASPEVVARVRAKRDSLKATERKVRKPEKARRKRIPSTQRAAALLLQRHARAWLQHRRKSRRRQRSLAAKFIQRSFRTRLLPRVEAKSSIAVTAAPPEPHKMLPSIDSAIAECAICWDADAEYAAVPCGHRCLCADCSKTLSQCPVCREQISTVLRVFV